MRCFSYIFLTTAVIVTPIFLKTSGNITFLANDDSGYHPPKVKFKREATSLRPEINTKGLRNYAVRNGFNSRYCFLIDMQFPSGTKRFHIYDLVNNSILNSGLVTHGSGNQQLSSDTIVFSNVVGSNCTSLGKYKIGKPYFGKFGLAYKLYGLDKTNSNAFSRFVVLHSHSCVPDETVEPLPICESWGCPTVSPAFLSSLKTYIEQSQQPLLLWIFN